MTNTDPKIETVQRLYSGYFRDGVDGVLPVLADDVDWAAEAAGDAVPWYGGFRGKQEVARFFEAIEKNVDISEFELVGIAANDTHVYSTIHWTYTVRATGRTASMYMQHWFRVLDGKIVFFRGSEDSGQSIAAFA